MKGYKTSKDYKRLKELLDAGYEVICFITYDFRQYDREPHEPLLVTDVCRARLLDKGTQYAHYSVSCRGTCFFDYWLEGFDYKYSFLELLEARNIEFIEPTELSDL